MAYDEANPPFIMAGAIAGPHLWGYHDADVDADVDAAGYFTDGDALGMKVGDWLLHYEVNATPAKATFFFVSATTAGGASTVIAGTVTV